MRGRFNISLFKYYFLRFGFQFKMGDLDQIQNAEFREAFEEFDKVPNQLNDTNKLFIH